MVGLRSERAGGYAVTPVIPVIPVTPGTLESVSGSLLAHISASEPLHLNWYAVSTRRSDTDLQFDGTCH